MVNIQSVSGRTACVGLFAYPISHSLSPTMWNAAFAQTGVDAVQLAYEVDADQLADAVAGARAMRFLGFNVSMPNKAAVIPLLDEVTDQARLIDAVNMVVNDRGRLKGYNTDALGAVRALEGNGVRIAGERFTLTGTGGAGKAIAIQLAASGARSVAIFNQKDAHFSDGEETVAKIRAHFDCQASLTDLADQEAFRASLAEAAVYVDATGCGMKPLEDVSLINDPALIRPDLVVFDTVYSPLETKLLRFAREHGAAKTLNGLEMLLQQGAINFQLITGKDMPIDAVRGILQEEIKKRQQ